MNSDPDKLWKHVAGRLRKEEGLCPPTPEEAQKAYDKAEAVPLSPERLQDIFDAATSDQIPACKDDGIYPWESELSQEGVMEDELALCHNEGEADPEAGRLERELQEKMLREDQERDQKR